MHEVMIVLRREFLERVRSKGFWIGTLLTPLFLGALFILPAVLGAGGGREHTLVLVDEAPAGVGDAFVRTLTAPSDDEDADSYRVERAAGPLAQVRADLNRRVLAEEIEAYVVLPADVVQSSEIAYRARNISSFTVQRGISRAASQAVQQERLREAGLQVQEVASLLRPVQLQAARITEQGEDAASAESTFWLAYISGFMIYMLVFLYGINVMRSVLEEKTNRIAEVIVSSVPAGRLMVGKILGVGSVALLQVAVWVGLGALGAWKSNAIAERVGLSPEALRTVSVEPWVLAATIGFFILGFFLYATLFAAVGAAVNSDQEAQQYQTIVFLPLIASLLFMLPVINDPLGSTATTLGLIPFTAPISMSMRLAAAALPPAQVATSLALLALTVGVMAWLSGKIYRVGILSTGKKPTLRELGRWLRAA
ncbi:MAG TPA: ABC transporter permease [Longimicrobiaceae bacterium]|nr:ABC transporter permease [Longimicrobiaceae bacterium]